MLSVYYQTVGLAQENTYVVVNEQNEALIFDPGGEADLLIAWIEENQWQPQAILLTHCHFDHIGAVDKVRERFDINVYVHEIEADYLSSPELNLSYGMLGRSVNQRPADVQWTQADMTTFKLNRFDLTIRHLPGHSPGHVVFIFDKEGFVIAGDTLFERSVGRTDLPGGSFEQLMQGIKTELLALPEETIIYPGHGSPTTIKAEKRFNPFLNR